MTTSDEAFLADIEHLLASCASSLDSVIDMRTECKTNESKPQPDLQFKIKPYLQKNKPLAKSKLEVFAKRELERAKDRKRRKAYRERRRFEREMLQRQVEELSSKLDRLQDPRDTNCSLSPLSWKAVAQQKLEELQIAELQQKCLKAAVQSRSRLIQELAEYARDRIGTGETLLEQPQLDGSQTKRVRLGSSDIDIFKTCLQELDAVYAQTDQVFRTDSVLQSTWTFDNRTGYFEYADKHEVPFDFNLASQLLWQLSHILHRREDRKLYDDVEDPANTIALKYRIERHLNCGQSVSLVQNIVGRRYHEKNRLVVVLRSFTEGEGLFRSLYSDEVGRCLAKPSLQTTEPATSLAICIPLEPMHVGNTQDNESVLEQFSHLLRTTGLEDVVEITSSLEEHLSKTVVC